MKSNIDLFHWKLLFKYDRGLILLLTSVICVICLISWIFGLSKPENRTLTFVIAAILGVLSYFIFETMILLERLEEKEQ